MHFGWLIYCRVKSSKDEARGDPISHGMQKQLSLARALATFSDPRLTQKKIKIIVSIIYYFGQKIS